MRLRCALGTAMYLGRFCVVGAALLLSTCAQEPEGQKCQMVNVARLKLTRHGLEWFVTISINGHDAQMAVDTGSEMNILTDDAANRFKMIGNGYRSVTLKGVGGLQGASVAIAETISMGAGRGKKVSFLTVEKLDEPPGVDGVLGMDFLAAQDIDLDVYGGKLGLYKAISGCHEPASAMAGPLFDIAMEDSGSDVRDLSPLITVSINGVNLRALIDTGSFHTTIFRRGAHLVGLDTGEALDTVQVHGVGSKSVVASVRISPPLQIGDLTIKNLPMVVADQRRAANADILLGYDFISRVHIWISHSSHSVIMQYPPTATPADQP